MAELGDKWQSMPMASEVSNFETELRAALAGPVRAGLIEIIPDSEIISAHISSAFPFHGSKIDWRLTTGHLSSVVPSQDNEFAAFSSFFNSRAKELGREAVVFYFNDSQIDCSLRASLWTFWRHLRPIIEVPGHHYFVADDFSWCMVLTMEGDMDFGYAAPTAS